MGAKLFFYLFFLILFIYLFFFFIALLIKKQERPTSSAILKAFLRYLITAGWTGGAGGRQMEKLPELGLNSGPQSPEPRTQPLHHTATCFTCSAIL